MTKIWGRRIVYLITKATNTHSEYVTLTAFPLQKWLHGYAPELHLRILPVLIHFLLIESSPNLLRSALISFVPRDDILC